MIETHPIPAIAKTAMALLHEKYQRTLNALAMETVEALGLDSTLDYAVNFDRGTITREIPDPPKDADPAEAHS